SANAKGVCDVRIPQHLAGSERAIDNPRTQRAGDRLTGRNTTDRMRNDGYRHRRLHRYGLDVLYSPVYRMPTEGRRLAICREAETEATQRYPATITDDEVIDQVDIEHLSGAVQFRGKRDIGGR